MAYNSELTFKDVVPKDLCWIKITWNKKIVYDDINGNETLESTDTICSVLADKIVYKVSIKIVQFHHVILDIIGEELRG